MSLLYRLVAKGLWRGQVERWQQVHGRCGQAREVQLSAVTLLACAAQRAPTPQSTRFQAGAHGYQLRQETDQSDSAARAKANNTQPKVPPMSSSPDRCIWSRCPSCHLTPRSEKAVVGDGPRLGMASQLFHRDEQGLSRVRVPTGH